MTTTATKPPTTQPTLTHAEGNAKAWAERIASAHEAHQFCTEGGEGRDLSREAKALLHEFNHDGDNLDDVAEAIKEHMRESVLSVDVRSTWQSVGEHLEAFEYQILLSYGGPALRLTGELDEHSEPYRVFMQHQDWGTPWIQWFDVDRAALSWFACLFWFGE